MPFRHESLRPVLWLAVLWLAVRAFPFFVQDPLGSFEAWQCHKLLDYGPVARAGCMIHIDHETGRLPQPERFNFIHHPLPIIWWDTLLFAAGGWALLASFHAAIKLAAFLLFYAVLARLVSRRAAFLAMALLALAPVPMAWDCDPNQIALAALIWPVALWLIVKGRESSAVHARLPWLLGSAVFIFGQVDWMSLTVVPALLVATRDEAGRWSGRALARELPANAAWKGILIGASLTAVLFLVQVVAYSPDFFENLRYVFVQSGAGRPTPKWKLLTLVSARFAVWVGVPLCLLGIVGFIAFRRRRVDPILAGALAYLPCFAAAAVALTGYFFAENTPYIYLAHALVLATAWAFETVASSRIVALAAFALALPHLLYGWIGSSVPAVSETGRTFAQAIARETEPAEIVLTDLVPQQPPLPALEPGIAIGMRLVADRFIQFDGANPETITRTLKEFPGAPMVYLQSGEGPIPPEVRARLLPADAPRRLSVTLAPAQPLLAERMRAAAWRFTGKFRAGIAAGSSDEKTVMMTLYRLQP